MAADGLPRLPLVLGELIGVGVAVGGDAQAGVVGAEHAHLRVLHGFEAGIEFHRIPFAETADAEVLIAVVDLIDGDSSLVAAASFGERDVHFSHDDSRFLSAADEGWLAVLDERTSGMQAQRAVVEELVVGRNGILEVYPGGMGEGLRKEALRGSDMSRIDRGSAIDYRPAALGPFHRGEEGLTAQVMIRAAEVAVSQEGYPPRAIRSLHKVAVSCALHLECLPPLTAVGEDGIVGVGLVGAFDVAAAGDGERVGQFGAPFGDEQVVVAILFIDMRPFGVASAHARPEEDALCELFACVGVDLAEPDAVVGVAHHVAASVLPIERGVDAPLFQPARLTPGAVGVGSRYDEVAPSAHVGGDEVEGAVVVAQRGGVDAEPGVGSFQRQLRGTGEDVGYLLPMNKVGGVIERHAWEVLEGRVDQIVVVSHAADGGVGVEARDNGIGEPDVLSQGRGRCKEQGYERSAEQFISFHFGAVVGFLRRFCRGCRGRR